MIQNVKNYLINIKYTPLYIVYSIQNYCLDSDLITKDVPIFVVEHFQDQNL